MPNLSPHGRVYGVSDTPSPAPSEASSRRGACCSRRGVLKRVLFGCRKIINMRVKAWNVRKVHRWLTLLFGIQLIIWAVTGAFMVLMQLPYIHGNHLVQEADRPLDDFAVAARFQEVVTAYPAATNVVLINRFLHDRFQHVFQVTTENDKFLLDPDSLLPIELNEMDIQALARLYYRPIAGQEPHLQAVDRFTQVAPAELNPRHLPVWRVDFGDRRQTSLYLSAQTGELVTKRHRAWRWFDIAWMLHIMDYQERENISTPWILFFTFTTFLIVLSGGYLLIRHFLIRKWRMRWKQ